MEFHFNHQINFDSLDISECKADNNLFNSPWEEYLISENIGGEDETEESTNETFNTGIRNELTNVNSNVNVGISPKIFEIIKDKTRRRK